ncbi:MAG: translation initiation factor IF-3 [Deltaproteobacteria bacterium]|nr:translation initiation factor IF-3 [Deltaproteobacteria bacterium]
MERPKKLEPRINDRIRVREVRVIGPEGDQLGILLTDEARAKANELGLDLVEVSPTARPPVCKIMDYGKFKYVTKKKAVEQRRNQKVIEVKEVKFRPKTDTHDVQIKTEHARRFLEEGNKVKMTIMFRGREITHPEIGQQMLERVSEQLKDVGMVEFFPRMEGRAMFMVLAPAKPGSRPVARPVTAPVGAPVVVPMAAPPVERVTEPEVANRQEISSGTAVAVAPGTTESKGAAQ